MTHEAFTQILSRNLKRQWPALIIILLLSIGFGITALGVFGHLDGIGQIVLGSISGYMFVLEAFLFFKIRKTRRQLNEGTHPLLQAIKTGDRWFVVWYYERIVHTNGGPNHQIRVYVPNKKCIGISVTGGDQARAVMLYLEQHFPDAIVGYSEEAKIRYRQQKS